MKPGITPGMDFDLGALKSIGSTGSPLPPEGFNWVYEHVKEDVWLFSTSGGTDLCTAFIGGCPLLPVRGGELQCRSLGARVEVYGHRRGGGVRYHRADALLDAVPLKRPRGRALEGELLRRVPGDLAARDFIKIKSDGSAVIHGRSDAVINRGGVKMGTTEIYRAVDSVDEVQDSLVIDTRKDGEDYMPLFVVLEEGVELDDDLIKTIKKSVRDASPRHMLDKILAVLRCLVS